MDNLALAAVERAQNALRVAAGGQRQSLDLVRIARAAAFAEKDGLRMLEGIARLYGDSDTTQRIAGLIQRDAVAGIGQEALPGMRTASIAFADAVRPLTVLGRLDYRPVPFQTHLPYLGAGTTFDFFAEFQPIACTAPTTAAHALAQRRVSGIVVASNELLKHSEADALLRRDFVAGIVAAQDQRLLDPASDETTARPASITHEADAVDAGGAVTAEDAEGVVHDLIGLLIADGSTLARCAFIASPTICAAIGALRYTTGQRVYPGVTVQGGAIAGIPLLASGSSPSGQLTLVDGDELLVADDGASAIDLSKNAVIDQSSQPAGNTRVSMFQAEATAFRVSRWVNWIMRQPFVAYAHGLVLPVPTFIGTDSES